MSIVKQREGITRVALVALAMIYLSALFVSTLHSYFAHTKVIQEVCTIEDENDRCHRSIYHHDNERGCDHESHLIDPVVECDQCVDIISIHISDYKTYLASSFEYNNVLIINFSSQVCDEDSLKDNFLRGPPHCT